MPTRGPGSLMCQSSSAGSPPPRLPVTTRLLAFCLHRLPAGSVSCDIETPSQLHLCKPGESGHGWAEHVRITIVEQDFGPGYPVHPGHLGPTVLRQSGQDICPFPTECQTRLSFIDFLC